MPISHYMLLLVLCLTFVPSVWAVSDIPPTFLTDYLDNDPEQLPDEYTNLSTNEEELDSDGRVVDPQGSWLTFVKYSDRANGKKLRKTKSKKKKKRRTLHGPPGPEGPQGPPGPAGPPGTIVTKEAMLEEFADLVREVATKRAEELVAAKCQACQLSQNSTYITTEGASDTLTIPRITAGFNMRLRGNIGVSRRTFMELKHFHQPFGGGAFHRGEVFNARDGRFVAPRDGIYQFFVKLHILIKKKSKKLTRLRRKDNITAMICIESLCQQYTSLKSVSGMDSNSKLFTINLGGLLEIKKEMYASVYVDNASTVDIVVTSGSEYSGILVGL
ncbi:hypothetical protein ScPMuIL_008657 [Solemya velum]